MTPTLLGRWQVRSLWLLGLGLPISMVFGRVRGGSGMLFVVLLYVWGLGLFWDVIYQGLQARRWDRDWPALFQIGAGLWEGLVLWGALQLPWVLGVWGLSKEDLTWDRFVWHYGVVFGAVWLATQTLHRVLFVHARFDGGRWL